VAELGQPRFIDHGPMTIAGIVRQFKPDTLSQLPLVWDEMQGRLGLVTGRVGGDAFGVWYDVLKGGGVFTYVAGAPVGEFAPIHPQFTRAFVPALHYAVFAHEGPPQELRRTMDAILSQWLPKSGREIYKQDENQPDFLERYSAEFNKTGQGPVEIWLPIKKK
jgi:AraC family transcriptional regulator